jgi:hypothetical protein
MMGMHGDDGARAPRVKHTDMITTFNKLNSGRKPSLTLVEGKRVNIENGYVDLVGAMFHRLRLDLRGETGACNRQQRAHNIVDAIAFLDDPQFEAWCALCGERVAAVRESMLAEIPVCRRGYVGHAEQ